MKKIIILSFISISLLLFYACNDDVISTFPIDLSDETTDPEPIPINDPDLEQVTRVVALSSNTTLNNIAYAEYTLLYLYDNGKVFQGRLLNDITYQGINFKGGTFSFNIFSYYGISFYPNGQVKNGTLAQDTTIDGTTYNLNQYIRFNQDGSVHSFGSVFDFSF